MGPMTATSTATRLAGRRRPRSWSSSPPDVQIQLAATWVALMLTYLLGDVLRIFSGDFKAGEIGGMWATPSCGWPPPVPTLVPS